MPLIALAYPAAVSGAKAIGVRLATSAAARGVQQGVRYAMSQAGQQVIKQGVKNVVGHQRVQQVKRGVKKAIKGLSSFYERNEKKLDFLQEVLEEMAEEGWDTFSNSIMRETKALVSNSQATMRSFKKSLRNYEGLNSSYPLYFTKNQSRPNSYRPRHGGFMPKF